MGYIEAGSLILITVAVVAILLVWEYRTQDCINGKPCQASLTQVELNPQAPLADNVDRLVDMVEASINYQTWRLSLIAGLVLAIPVDYLLLNQFPTISQWLITVVLIFIGAYFSASWLWSHWVQPNSVKVIDGLHQLTNE